MMGSPTPLSVGLAPLQTGEREETAGRQDDREDRAGLHPPVWFIYWGSSLVIQWFYWGSTGVLLGFNWGSTVVLLWFYWGSTEAYRGALEHTQHTRGWLRP